MSTALAVQDAIVAMILDCSPAVVPITTLTADALVGATSLSVASTSDFVSMGTLGFDDGSSEALQTIASATGTSINLDYTGLPSGLTVQHAGGTRVYTNLMAGEPAAVGPMIANGWPFLAVSVTSEAKRRVTMGPGGHDAPSYIVTIGAWRTLKAPKGIAPNRWASDQQAAGRRDFDTIEAALRADRTLRGTAIGLGDAANPNAPLVTRAWARLVSDREVQTWYAEMRVAVRATWDSPV